MAEALAAAVEFGPHQMTLDAELIRVLIAGNTFCLEELLSREGRGGGHGHLAINVQDAEPGAVAAPRSGTSCLLGVTSNGNTALHLVASRGHVELATLICDRAPSLVATRNKCLDTPLHCAAKAGHRDVAAFLLSKMRAGGEEGEAALWASNCLGATALQEAVRHSRTELVILFVTEAPKLASVTTDDGVSALYSLAMTRSERMVRELLRPSPDGTPSPASFAGREGRTALHVAAACSAEMVEEILAWIPEGPALLTRVDSSGRSPLHFAVQYRKLDVVKLVLNVEASLARISDKDGSFPLHAAAMVGSTRIIDELIKKCPDYYELVDDKGRNFLHSAVEHNQVTVVRYVCQNDRFAMLLNATDFEGNTPLHVAAKNRNPRIVSFLLQTMTVEMNVINKDGLTATDLAYNAFVRRRSNYFLDPNAVVFRCLMWAGARCTLDRTQKEDEPAKEELQEKGDTTESRTIASVLIATVAFAAAVTVPGGFVADDHANSGTAILAKRFAFRAFVVSDTVAFLCSTLATCYLIYGGAGEIPLNHRRWYNLLASGLVPLGAQFMIAAFAFGFHLVLGAANRGLMIFVYMVSSASVLFCFPGIWVPLCHGFGKAIWRRAGWRGLVNIRERPSNLLEFLCLVVRSPLFKLRRTIFAVLISATFVVAIALDIALPNY